VHKAGQGARASYAECDGAPVIVMRHAESGAAYDIVRLEESDGVAVKITDYCYAPETLAQVGSALGITFETMGYHQQPATIRRMVETTGRPWRSI
jgi:hypothetical protein